MKRFLLFFIIGIFIMTGCAQKKEDVQGNDYVVTIKTRYGDMIAILYDETPKHKQNFIKLAKEHFYDSTLFHRVIEGFMIQGGDPTSKKAPPGIQLGQGDPGYTIDAEFNPKFFHERGALCAARKGDQVNPTKASNGSQFYIVQGRVISEDELKLDQGKLNQAMQQYFQDPVNKPAYDSIIAFSQAQDVKGFNDYLVKLKPRVEKATGMSVEKEVPEELVKAYTTVGGVPALDGQYTVFGKVIKGLEVVDKIAVLKKDPANRPLENISMTMSVEEMPKKKIEKVYGYRYPQN